MAAYISYVPIAKTRTQTAPFATLLIVSSVCNIVTKKNTEKMYVCIRMHAEVCSACARVECVGKNAFTSFTN